MKNSIAILLLISNFSSFAQTIKTYNGNYEEGIATYSYFENENYERIFNGIFKYSNISNYYNLNIQGQYKNNKKEGTWKATTDKPYDYNETFFCNYKDGNLNGECSYLRVNKKTKKVDRKITTQFKNNIMIGTFNTVFDDDFKSFSISFSLNENGYIDGEFKINDKKGYEEIRKYKNGFLFWHLVRENSTGKILKKMDRESFVDYIISRTDSSKNTIYIPLEKYESLEDSSYLSQNAGKINDIKYLYNKFKKNAYNEDTTNAYKILNIPFNITNKDVSIYESNWDILIAINYWNNTKEQYYGGIRNPLYKITHGANPTNHKLTNELSINNDLHLQDFKVLSDLQSENQKRLIEEKKEKELFEKYKKHISNGNEYLTNKNFEFAILEFKNALKIKQDENIYEQIKIAEIQKAEHEKEESKRKEIEKEEKRIETLKKENKKLQNDIEINNNTISGNSAFIKKNKILNNAYLILYDLSSQIDDEERKLKHLRNLKLLQENINYLANLNNTLLEKQLKNVTDSNEIWRIIKYNMKLSWY